MINYRKYYFIWIKVPSECGSGNNGSVHQAEPEGRGLVNWTSAIISTLTRYEGPLCIFAHENKKNESCRLKTIYKHTDSFGNCPGKLHIQPAMPAPQHHCSNVGRNHLTYSYKEKKLLWRLNKQYILKLHCYISISIFILHVLWANKIMPWVKSS